MRMPPIVRALRDAGIDHAGFIDLYGKRPWLNRAAAGRRMRGGAFDTGGPPRKALPVRCSMQPSSIATHLYVETPQDATARPEAVASPMPRPYWGDRALLAAERRLLPPRARPMSRAAARGQRGLWFRTAAIFMMSLSAGLLGLNLFLLFNSPRSEAATPTLDRNSAALSSTLPSPRAPAQGYVASAAGVGRVIIAEAQPVATLTTDAYAMVGNRVQAADPRRDVQPPAQRVSGRPDGWVEPVSTPIPVNMSMPADPVSVAESQARADEAMRVIAASTPSVHRTAARDPALVDDASPTASMSTHAAAQGLWYGDGGLR